MRRITIRILLAALLVLSSHVSTGKELATAKPEKVGMSSERLERLSDMNQKYVDEGKFAGVVTMVARHGKIIHLDAAGTYGVDNTKPINQDTLFRIYSMTKPITAIALMMLYEEGAFQLNDPVSKFLPQFANMKVWTMEGAVDAKTPITMHQLLTHTAGLSYGFDPENPVDKLYRELRKTPAADLDAFIDNLVELPLLFEPGERWHYSVASDVLGAVAEKISGMSFAQFLQQRVFDPLDMDNTFFNVPGEKADLFATNHRWDPKSKQLTPLLAGSPLYSSHTDVSLFLGGHGLVSTIGDYMKFAEMMRNGGKLNGARLLSPKTIEFMTQNHLGATTQVSSSGEAPSGTLSASLQGTGFGLGFGIIMDPAKWGAMSSAGTYFWGGAAGTVFWIDPVEDIVGIGMVQLMGSPWPFRQEMMVMTYQAMGE
ncbi:MAG: serine hydrolase domain-containing protein [Halioglobus sp.]